jgi:hypothetical protein
LISEFSVGERRDFLRLIKRIKSILLGEIK